MRDFISLTDLSPRQWKQLLHLSREVKQRPSNFRQMIPGKSLVLIFEKPSLRTRLTFELGIQQLGGDAVYLDYQEANLGKREALRDVAKNLERWFNCLVARTFSHQVLVQLSNYANCSVINALTDKEHPCQAMADIFTLTEKWSSVEGRTMAYVGDGNNVCASLIHAAALSGMCFRAVTPKTRQPYPNWEEDFQRLSSNARASCQWTDSLDGIRGADVVYTDTWVSMGQEEEAKERLTEFESYQVTPELMERTGKDSFFMHCLPAHRNQEVTDTVIDAPYSLVFEQAENRLHVQKALIMWLLVPKEVDRYFHLEKWAAWQ